MKGLRDRSCINHTTGPHHLRVVWKLSPPLIPPESCENEKTFQHVRSNRLWLANGEEEAATGGRGEDSDDRWEEEAAAGGRGEDSDNQREEAVGASAFGAAAVAEADDSSREAREEGSIGG
ncbi:hypothetical protein B296_00054528 [Ensete ventricosum]|uniref:Uncharacterized protein n=1 Tax=Ensete ventricosum TaxID=4639 RepID=A0A426XEB4_ENSVE|nr:hypothetical protein B296_00054528 [Ensete ventricosum]